MPEPYFNLFQLSHFDLSPNFSGTLYGIANTLSNICGFVSPTVIGLLTNGNVSQLSKSRCQKVQSY